MATLLLVEDDPDIADILAYLLRREGHQVVLAADGVAALCQFHAEPPDVVLLDLQLPRLSGLAVCRAIRAAARTPILRVSALADADTRRVALAAGADDYLLKPFGLTQLLACVHALLSMPRATEAAA